MISAVPHRAGHFERSQLKWGYFFIWPCIFGLAAFAFGPMIFSFFMSFTQWDIVTAPQFTAAQNYLNIFKDPLVGISLRVTVYYTVLSVPLVTITAFLTAVLLNSGVKGIGVFRTIFYIPSIVPSVASAAIWLYIFDPMFGLLNSILKSFGLPAQPFIYSRAGVIPGLAMMAVWSAGNTVIIYLAGLQGISRELYEAADLDGANGFQRFTRITAPLMTPIIFFNVLMAMIGALQTFTQAFIMTGGGPNNASLFYSLLLYNTAFKFNRMGYASAMSWVLFVIIAALTFIVFRTSDRWVFYESKAS